MAKLTTEAAQQHIAALEAFRAAYEGYIKGGRNGPSELRLAVQKAMPAAQEALDRTGGGTVVFDPPAAGPTRMQYRGLANVAFLHERPGFRMTPEITIQAVFDDLDRVQAQLEHHITKLERGDVEREEERDADQAVFCERGHFIGTGPEAPFFCEDCGAPSVTSCSHCGDPVRGRANDHQRPIAFCGQCGAAFPWVDRQGRIYQLENLLSREQLDEATTLVVREQLQALAAGDLPADEQSERWQRVKALAPGLLKSGGAIVQTLVTAEMRRVLGV